jgi:excisionase family DNA binding protein
MCLIAFYIVPLPQIQTWSEAVSETRKQKKEIERIFLSFQEAQEFLNISHQTVYKLMKDGLLSHKIGKKRVFLREDLVRWINEH